MFTFKRLNTLIEAGHVTRFHSVPTVKENTVAQHTFNMLLILDYVYEGLAPGILYKAILYHDLHEVETGDIPHTTKHKSAEIRNCIKRVETEAAQKLGTHIQLDKTLDRVLRFIDMVEIAFYLRQEILFGNQNQKIETIYFRAMSYANDILYEETELIGNERINRCKDLLVQLRHEHKR